MHDIGRHPVLSANSITFSWKERGVGHQSDVAKILMEGCPAFASSGRSLTTSSVEKIML